MNKIKFILVLFSLILLSRYLAGDKDIAISLSQLDQLSSGNFQTVTTQQVNAAMPVGDFTAVVGASSLVKNNIGLILVVCIALYRSRNAKKAASHAQPKQANVGAHSGMAGASHPNAGMSAVGGGNGGGRSEFRR